MSLYNLITEIKNRILLLVFTWFSTFLVGYLYKQILLFNVIKSNKAIVYFIITDITEVFITYIKLNQFLANYFFMFYFLYHLFLFLMPGLYHKEYNLVKKFIFLYLINSILFTTFVYYVGSFLVWSFFFKLQKKISNQIFQVHFETKLDQFLKFYLSFFHAGITTALIATFLIVFSIFIIRTLFILKSHRKLFHFLFFILSILLTPSDLFSFIVLGLTFLTFFELVLFFKFLKI